MHVRNLLSISLSALLLAASSCSFESVGDTSCKEGERANGRECIGGVWVVTGADGGGDSSANNGADGSNNGNNGNNGTDMSPPDMGPTDMNPPDMNPPDMSPPDMNLPDAMPDGNMPDMTPDMPGDMPPDMPCIGETEMELCMAQSAECGTITVTDSCMRQRMVDCGVCTAPDSCVNNACVCVAESPAAFCTRLGKDCGMVTDNDNCGDMQTYDCGACSVGINCGDQQPNVCGCPCNIAGTCYADGAENPANPCEICDPMSSTTAWSVDNGKACDDGDLCTENDTCNPAGNCGGSDKDCSGLDTECTTGACNPNNGACESNNVSDGTSCSSDGLNCTTDQCMNGVCDHSQLQNNRCLIGGTCYQDGQNVSECRICDVSSATRSATIDVGASCSGDALSCTTDTCNAQGTCDSTLSASSCLISNTCFADGDRETANGCQVCDPSSDQNDWSDATAITCDDGFACTSGSMCNAGTCNQGTVDSGFCLIGGNCLADNDQIGGLVCQICDSGNDQSAATIPNGMCFIDGSCYADNDTNPASPECQRCDAGQNQTGWTNFNQNMACGPGSGCKCDAGICEKNGDPGLCTN